MSMSPPIISSVNHLNVSTNSCGRTAFAYTVTNVLSIVLDPTDFEYADITFDYFTQIAPYVFCSNRLWCAFICDGGVNLVDACYIKYVSRLCGSMLSKSWLTARTAAVFRYLCQASCSLWFGLGLSTCQQPMNWGECSSSMIASTILLCLRFCSFSARCWWQRRRCNRRVWKQFGLVLAWHKRIRCQTDHHYHWWQMQWRVYGAAAKEFQMLTLTEASGIELEFKTFRQTGSSPESCWGAYSSTVINSSLPRSIKVRKLTPCMLSTFQASASLYLLAWLHPHKILYPPLCGI